MSGGLDEMLRWWLEVLEGWGRSRVNGASRSLVGVEMCASVSSWMGVKLHGYLKEQLGLEVGYSTTVRYLLSLATSAGARPGRNANMKSNAMLS